MYARPYCTYVYIRADSKQRGRERDTRRAHVCLSLVQRVMDFTPVSPPVNSFLFSFFFPRSAPGATLLLPGRVTSNDAGSHYHPYLRGFIAPSAQPSSHFPSYPAYIYIRGTDRVAAQSRLFLTFRLSICNNSVGETWVHLRIVLSLHKVRAPLYLYRVSLIVSFDTL